MHLNFDAVDSTPAIDAGLNSENRPPPGGPAAEKFFTKEELLRKGRYSMDVGLRPGQGNQTHTPVDGGDIFCPPNF